MGMKPITLRMPVEVLEWLREKSARETIRQKKYVSLNAYVVEVLQREMESDQKKGRA
jgi:hypothetical protein